MNLFSYCSCFTIAFVCLTEWIGKKLNKKPKNTQQKKKKIIYFSLDEMQFSILILKFIEFWSGCMWTSSSFSLGCSLFAVSAWNVKCKKEKKIEKKKKINEKRQMQKNKHVDVLNRKLFQCWFKFFHFFVHFIFATFWLRVRCVYIDDLFVFFFFVVRLLIEPQRLQLKRCFILLFVDDFSSSSTHSSFALKFTWFLCTWCFILSICLFAKWKILWKSEREQETSCWTCIFHSCHLNLGNQFNFVCCALFSTIHSHCRMQIFSICACQHKII